jgi:FixJ family two-component response regulator
MNEQDLRNHIIAVVDDDQRVANALQGLLESVGYEALSFRSADALLCSPDLGRISCVITDIGMPGINGFELRQRLHLDSPWISVILITGRYELVEDGLPHGKINILRKPFDSSELLAAISESLR